MVERGAGAHRSTIGRPRRFGGGVCVDSGGGVCSLDRCRTIEDGRAFPVHTSGSICFSRRASRARPRRRELREPRTARDAARRCVRARVCVGRRRDPPAAATRVGCAAAEPEQRRGSAGGQPARERGRAGVLVISEGPTSIEEMETS